MFQFCRIKKPSFTGFLALGLLAMMTSSAPATLANEPGTGNSSEAAKPSEIDQLRDTIQQALANIQVLQQKLDAKSTNISADDIKAIQQEIDENLAHVQAVEKRLDAMDTAPAPDPSPAKLGIVAGRGPETTPGVTTGLAPADIYNNGFFVATEDKSFSMYVNGLFQMRYTGFKPQDNVEQFGSSSAGSNDFDVFLGRVALSGSAFDPSIKYFLQMQGSTAGNGNDITMLDWFTSKTFSKYLSLQAGRFWTPYTYEYYDSPGNYLFADLSTAEYAFALPRAIGLEASGQAGRISYAAMVANSIRALDAGGQENFTSRVAYIGNIEFNILAPYGYIETDPNPAGAKKAELSLWSSAAYNPITDASAFENVNVGDKTVNATSTMGFRYGFFTLQATGYFRQTTPAASSQSDNSWGYTQQTGYYLVPGKFEVAERISGVNWGAEHFMPISGSTNTWFSGPNFAYHKITEYSLGLNYYLHGHNAKVQAAYSYLDGNTFTASKFGANRVWIQTQLMF